MRSLPRLLLLCRCYCVCYVAASRVHDADNSIVALAHVQLVRDPEVT